MKEIMEQDQTGMTVRDGASEAPEVARVTAEVQARKVMAKRFPRDEVAACTKIAKACARKGLAESAIYAFKRGGQMVTGPSIHLLKAVAQHWGNVSTGIVEIERGDGWSKVRAFAVDDETNFQEERVFVVNHVRDSTAKGKTKLTEERDIYELIANMGSRRQRACLETVVPRDVIDDAVRSCESTLAGDGKEPLIDRAKKMVVAFQELGVTQPMIESYLSHKLDAVTPSQFVKLYKIYASIKDGVSQREEWFDVGTEPKPASEKAQALTDRLKQKVAEEPKAAPPAAAAPPPKAK